MTVNAPIDSGPGVVPAALIALLLAATAWLVDLTIRKAGSGSLGPNRVVGLRAPTLMASPRAWKTGHEAASHSTRIAAWTATVLAAVNIAACGTFVPYLMALGALIATLLGGVLLGTVRGIRAVRRMS